MSIAEKLNTIAENMEKVYDAGKEKYYGDFWDGYLNKEGVSSYSPYRFAGQGWKDSTFQPPKSIIFKQSATGLFRQSSISNLKKILENKGITIDTSQATNLQYAFGYAKFKYLPKISMISAKSNTDNCFANNAGQSDLISIDEIEINETTTFKSSFNNCNKLEHAIFTGTLATNGLNLSWSTLLDKESILSILNCLKDYSQDTSGTTYYITIGTENIAKLTEEEKLIATNKGWDIR